APIPWEHWWLSMSVRRSVCGYDRLNAYHQPGVEAGKRGADAILELQDSLINLLARGGESQTVGWLAKKTRSDGDLVFDILKRLETQKRHAVLQTYVGETIATCA